MAVTRTFHKWLLGKEIEYMIRRAGVTQMQAANVIEVAQSKMANLIAGRGAISVGDLERLANALGFTDSGYQEKLLDLRRDNSRRGCWSTGYMKAYAPEIRLRIGAEKSADRIRSVEIEVVPGLLQCESYVRALYAGAPDVGALTHDDRVDARMARQDIFDRENPPVLQFVLSESCLRRVMGDAAVMREQSEYIVKLSERPNLMVQVLPFRSASRRRTLTWDRFTLLRVQSPGAAGQLELGYVEGVTGIRYVDDKDALSAYDLAWSRLSAAALSFEESREFVREVAHEFR
ncbi:Scr1 family TA system antitoxin-like transcriptional regulator [Kibdelosporangium lantanae]|uniref:Scr1 family TA system antitoxin-like transcriptional regulator n=1 Tax=Kibdelosporangium lantanae TaxID=1497396 RepID=A0ABW3M6Y3_9PSEU